MLKFLAVVLSCAGVAAAADLQADPSTHLGLQAWTFHRGTFLDAVAEAKRAGIRNIEAYPGQPIGGGIEGTMAASMSREARTALLARLGAEGVRLHSFGIVTPPTEEGWKELFAFAREMGIGLIVSQPDAEQMDIVESLCRTHGVKVAIHNHPQPSRYWSPELVLEALANRSSLIGASVDTGHWVRSGLAPVECMRKLEGRILGVHMKDLDGAGPDAADVPWGTGRSDVAAQLAELRRQGFRGVVTVEYERSVPDLAADVSRCAEFFRSHLASP